MRRAHKLLSLLLVLTLALSISAPVGAAYSDTSGHWAESAIDRWSAYGIVSGDGNGFNPDGNLTRGQMAKVLAETLGLTKQGDNPFADVPAGAWYAPYVLRCYEAGIMMGDGVNANPNAPITREEAMVMLCRALRIAPASEGALASFNDGGSVASWAAPYVAAMVQSGIVSGVGNNTLAPTGNISRAALMTILDRSIVQYINEPGSYELTDKAGIVLVAAGDVTLTGSTSADVLVSPAAEGKAVAFDGATVTGSVTVQAEDVKVTSENSTLPDVSFTGEGGGKVEQVKPAEPAKPSTGGGSSGGSSGGGSSTPSHTHTWDDGTVTTAATCTTEGVKTFTCTGCSETKTEPIEATGHTPAETYTTDETGHWHVCTACSAVLDKEAHDYGDVVNCTEEAVCEVCDYAKEAGTHIWGAGVVTTPATCTEKGEMTYTCTSPSCDTDDGTEGNQPATKTEEIPANGHTEVTDAAVAATCTEAGKTEGKHCSVCATVLVAQETVPATGHTEVTDAAVAATCTEAGKTEGKHCSVCDTVLVAQETVTATGHSYGDWEEVDITNHKRVCANDATHVETESHRWSGSTCTVCGATRTVTDEANLRSELRKGGEVILGADITLTEVIVLNSSSKLKLNGHTLTGKIFIFDNKSLTIDGTVAGSRLKRLEEADDDDAAIIEAEGNSEVSITGGTYDGPILVGQNAKITITGGTFEPRGVIGALGDTTVSISGGTFRGAIFALGTLSISDGIFENDLVVGENATASISGGTFDVDPTDYVDSETHTVTDNEDGTWTVTAK